MPRKAVRAARRRGAAPRLHRQRLRRAGCAGPQAKAAAGAPAATRAVTRAGAAPRRRGAAGRVAARRARRGGGARGAGLHAASRGVTSRDYISEIISRDRGRRRRRRRHGRDRRRHRSRSHHHAGCRRHLSAHRSLALAPDAADAVGPAAAEAAAAAAATAAAATGEQPDDELRHRRGRCGAQRGPHSRGAHSPPQPRRRRWPRASSRPLAGASAGTFDRRGLLASAARRRALLRRNARRPK